MKAVRNKFLTNKYCSNMFWNCPYNFFIYTLRKMVIDRSNFKVKHILKIKLHDVIHHGTWNTIEVQVEI